MSTEPNTPEDWRTITIQGHKCDIGPDATVGDLFEKVRYLIGSKALRVPGGTASRHAYTAERYALVKKSVVGTDASGDWNPPDGPEEYVAYDLADVEDGDELRVYGVASAETPVYEEADT